jgi:hypothetical protein
MKRKTVFPHRTVKMREDFLEWARRQSAVKQQAQPDDHPAPAEAPFAPGLHAWADDGGALPGAPDDNPAARQRRQANE